MRAQGSFTAVFSIVIIIGILFFGIVHIVRSVEALGKDSANDAIIISNDLLINPGHNGTSLDWRTNPVHIGFAKYSLSKKSIEDHVLSIEKINAVSKIPANDIKARWGIGKAFAIEIVSLDGFSYLNISQLDAGSSFVEIRRLAMIEKDGEYETVRLSFRLQE